jgi:WD40 repeat protein
MTLRRQLPDQYRYMCAPAFSVDGRRVALVEQDRHIRIWDLASGTALVRTEKPHSKSVGSLALSPDGKRLVSSCNDNDEIWLWDAATGKHNGTLLANQGIYPGGMHCLAFSADSRRLAGGGMQYLVVWDAATGELVHRFERASGGSIRVWFSPNQSDLTAVKDFHGQGYQDGTRADIYPSVRTWTIPEKN